MPNSQTGAEIQTFIETPKFSPEAWKRRMVNPSDARMCQRMEAVLNDMARKVLPLVQVSAAPSMIKSVIASSLRSTSTLEFDTEEREFICDEIERLARMANVKVGNVLNRGFTASSSGHSSICFAAHQRPELKCRAMQCQCSLTARSRADRLRRPLNANVSLHGPM